MEDTTNTKNNLRFQYIFYEFYIAKMVEIKLKTLFHNLLISRYFKNKKN